MIHMYIDNRLRLAQEANSSILLFKEGVFAKMYNESAYLFCENFTSYKVNVTTRKKGSTYYSVGFPLSILPEKFIGCDIKTVDDSYSVIEHGNFVFDALAFEQWCVDGEQTYQELQQEKAAASVDKKIIELDLFENEIIRELYNFRLESASPMDCMQFVHRIQQKLYGKLSKPSSI